MKKLSESQTAILAEMGIQVWYKRASGAVDTAAGEAVLSPAPSGQQSAGRTSTTHRQAEPDIAPATKQVTPVQDQISHPDAGPRVDGESAADFALETVVQGKISFQWWKNSSAMIWLPEEDTGGELEPFCRDVLKFVQARVDEGESKVAKGNFLWPQVGGSSGTPERPLRVFVDKHAAEARYLVVTRSVAESVEEFLLVPESAQLVVVDNIFTYLTDPDKKKSLWQALAK